MDYRSLKEWDKEIEEECQKKNLQLLDNLVKSKPLFEKPYIEWMYGFTPEEPIAYYCDFLSPPIFPKLWATLPFYKTNLVGIPFSFRNRKNFQQWFRMDIETFKTFCEYGKIKPLIYDPKDYRNKHFLDPILRESISSKVSTSVIIALTKFSRMSGSSIFEMANELFPRNKVFAGACLELLIFGFNKIPFTVRQLVEERKISKRTAGNIIYNAAVYYAHPLTICGGETLILTEASANWFELFGFIKRRNIQVEIREDLLEWLGFRLPENIDRKYISRYIEICDDISPELHKVVMKIENKARRYENARDELSLIVRDLESELELITKRRDTLVGAIKWLTAFPISIAQDLLGKMGFEKTRGDLETAKTSLKEYVASKVRDSSGVGEVISAITRKGYLVRNVWRIKEKTRELQKD